MATSIKDTITLRDAVAANFITKADTLDVSEGDTNFETLGKWGQEMEAAVDVPAYNAATSYSSGDQVKSGGQFWTYVNATAGIVATPGTNDAVWQLTTIGELIHRKNQDSQLVGSSGTAITADELIALAGEKYTLNLDGTTGNGKANEYVDISSPAEDTVIDKYTVLVIDSDLTPDTATPKFQIVLHDGTPANDVAISNEMQANETNAIKKDGGDAINTVKVTASQTLKLKVTGADLSGTIQIKIYNF